MFLVFVYYHLVLSPSNRCDFRSKCEFVCDLSAFFSLSKCIIAALNFVDQSHVLGYRMSNCVESKTMMVIFFLHFSHGIIQLISVRISVYDFFYCPGNMPTKKDATVANIFFPFCSCALSFVYLSVTRRFADYTLKHMYKSKKTNVHEMITKKKKSEKSKFIKTEKTTYFSTV